MKNLCASMSTVFLALLCFMTSAQDVTLALIESYSYQDLNALADEFGLPEGIIDIKYPVDYYKINYPSTDQFNEAVTLSGALIVPHGANCALPLISYQHGTVTLQSNVPSQMNGEGILGVLFATAGFIVTMPDYHGLGDHDALHPYIHAETQATAALDIITSSIEVIEEVNLDHNGEKFLMGYSQGGHATMALHRQIETNALFDITASAPMSGPYDMSVTQYEAVFEGAEYASPPYIPYLILSYEAVYGDIYDNLSEVFVSPYDETIPDLFDGTHALGEVAAALPADYTEMMQPSFLLAMEDTLHPMRLALKLNDVYNWAPTAPTTLYYCNADEQVPFENALVAEAAFIDNGAEDVSTQNLGPFTHSICALFAVLEGFDWFLSLATLPDLEASFDIFPATTSTSNDGSILTTVPNGSDYNYLWENEASEKDRENLDPGEYELTITNTEGCSMIYAFNIDLATGIHEDENHILNCYPNPAHEVLTLEVPTNGWITLVDMNGRTVMRRKVNAGTQTVELPTEAAGLYTLIYQSKRGATQKRLMIH